MTRRADSDADLPTHRHPRGQARSRRASRPWSTRTRARVPTACRRSPGVPSPWRCPEQHDVLGTPLPPPFPCGLEQTVCALGCFWSAEVTTQPQPAPPVL